MKALSIKQPWASLIVAGIKDVENRSWRTHFRGRIYIHASQKEDKGKLFTAEQMIILPLGTPKKHFSAIIGEVTIYDCVQNSGSHWGAEGQWHWMLKDALEYDFPIQNIKGKLSFWTFDDGKPHGVGYDVLPF